MYACSFQIPLAYGTDLLLNCLFKPVIQLPAQMRERGGGILILFYTVLYTHTVYIKVLCTVLHVSSLIICSYHALN